MPELIGKTTIRGRHDISGWTWLHVEDQLPNHISSRGNLCFRTPSEIKAAIRELTRLLPAVDQLGELVR